ncbi:MAG TPA: DegT/DnrJ/EryC1/StrS family aminotransferase [Candidatus Limnocylindria bacterium]|jgi:dTDP-4-amino-4,6-dideoxygalactose transaminase|nr:DegT/DnrJ/EryC1/StrS family aminotransferase [Candidatus Limnocylindria bacterium]
MTDVPRRIWLARPQTDEAEIDEIRGVMESGTLTQGPKVAEFEGMVAERIGAAQTFATTSATTALHLTLAALGIGPGDEVLVPDFTFPATANVVVQQGAVPVLVDIDLATFAMDPADLAGKVTPRARAVIPVHPFGLPADMDPILEVAARDGLAVVEDAACALGADYHKRPVGSIGLAGCFSFHPRKSITTGEGGMIATSDATLAERIRLLRSHGGIRQGGRFVFEEAGFNYRMSDILAAVGVAQLRKLDEMLRVRRAVAALYDRALEGVAGVRAPGCPAGSSHTYQSYVVLLDPELDRDAVIARLAGAGIETTLGTYALHAQPFFARSFGRSPGDIPSSFRAFVSSLALPLHAGITSAQVDEVVGALKAAISSA